MKTKFFFSVTAICSLQFAVCNLAFAQNSNGLWFGLGPDTAFTNRHVKINRTLFVLQKMVAKVIIAEKIKTQKITADTIAVNGSMKMQGNVSADSIHIQRILPPEGDSVIHFGKNSVSLNLAANRISWTPVPSSICPGGIRGLAIGNGFILPLATGLNSIVMGSNTFTFCNATNSIVMGAGVAGNPLGTNLPNSLLVGFNSNIPTLFVSASAGIGTTGNVGIGDAATTASQKLDVDGKVRVRDLTGAPHNFVVTSETNGTLHSIAFTGNANQVLLGNGTFGFTPAAPSLDAWLLGGNDFMNSNLTNLNNILGTTEPGVHLNIYAGNALWQFIDANTGFIGIDNGSPNDRLDVNNGDIDVNIPANGYEINDQYVLRHNGNPDNIFAGVGAGNSNPTGTRNTFLGRDAGFSSVLAGNDNTYLGYQAGFLANAIGNSENTFVGSGAGRSYSERSAVIIGFQAGFTAPGADNVVFIGYQSGYRNKISGVGGGENVFCGSQTGYMNDKGNSNTFIGFLSGQNNVDGTGNTFVGNFSGNQNLANENTFIGAFSGGSNIGSPSSGTKNVFVGFASGRQNTISSDNTLVGYKAGYYNDESIAGGAGRNTFVGSEAGLNTNIGPNKNAYQNTFLGSFAGHEQDQGTFNTAVGTNAGFEMDFSDNNTFVGGNSGQNTGTSSTFTTPGGSGNTFVGGQSGITNDMGNFNTIIGVSADVSTTNLNNAAAIGSGAIVTAPDKMILGNNNVNVGIGLSADPIPPSNKLEINTSDPFPNTTLGGNSGLRFRDLSANATNPTVPIPNQFFPPAVLSVNQFGDVILVPDASGAGAPFFQCNPAIPVITDDLPFDSWWQLNQKNFLFEGNGQGSAVNNVGIGLLGANICFPLAKLHVQQSSGSAGSIGVKILNTDGDAAGLVVNTGNSPYSLIVPPGGYEGTQLSHQMYLGSDVTSLGITGTNMIGATLLYLGNSGDGTNAVCLGGGGWLNTSDASLKTNINTISGSLESIRKIRGVSFDWIGTNRHDFGFIAQEIDTVLPFLIKYDSAHSVRVMDMSKITPLTVEAIKQLDSTISAPPSAPVLISPADGATGDFRAVTFTWHSVSPGIILYRAQLATDNSFSNIIIDQRGITDTTAAFGFCDTLPVTYYWRVSAKNNAGAGAWSAVFSFTDTAKCEPIRRDTIISPKTAVAFNSTSDSRLKTNIAPVTSALDKVNALSGIYYNWVQTPGYEFDNTQQIGLIAQDVQAVVPEVVHTDSNGYLTLDYGRMVPVLVEAIKEQKQTIQSLQSAVGSLQSIVSECCSTNVKTTNTTIPSTELELASASAILYQNIPNPFGDGTVIRYFVPKNSNAFMKFFDEFGNSIKTVELPHKGTEAKLNLSTSHLAAGIYSYSLVVNGKIADTKKMLRIK